MIASRSALRSLVLLVVFVAAGWPGSGCASTSIAMKEKLGYAKREQLVDRVEDTRDAQEEAKAQFATTLEELKSLSGFDGGELEKAYNRLSRELERSKDRAEGVRDRIAKVERVAEALFDEWEEELGQYTTDSLRKASAAQLEQTRARYAQLLGAMQKAEAKMEPVLAAFGDQVLFLKHNLNARAIASLDDAVVDLEGEISSLIADMESSIAEANAFIDEMSAPPG
jgi:hypothetical protein